MPFRPSPFGSSCSVSYTRMARQQGHDTAPPQGWPSGVVYLTKSRISASFPAPLVPLLRSTSASGTLAPKPVSHPSHLAIKTVTTSGHPAQGQAGLFAKKKIGPNELLIPYLGVLHASFTPDPNLEADTHAATPPIGPDEHTDSDYDLSLLRLSSADPKNPFPGFHVSIGVDAARCGNAGRFVNDYRGIGTAANAEFRLGHAETGELRMEIWSLKSGVGKGDEILVSYGKGWWGARNGA